LAARAHLQRVCSGAEAGPQRFLNAARVAGGAGLLLLLLLWLWQVL
jgi:hypothetical protein